MDSVRSEEEEDEFTCPGMLRGSLSSLHSSVQRIFRVRFSIGTDQPPQDAHGQIWLQLRGLHSDVQAAKLFVKGVVNQEEQKEVPYPLTLHCVFCGARGLFMDCLIRNTSALIVIGSPGRLLISGLLEPVVRAYSLITDLVERCDSTQPKRLDPGERVLGESLESRRAFKNLVEQWDDRHTLDLLVLPGAIKECLLELIKEARLGDNPRPLEADGAKQDSTWDKSILSLGESSSSSSYAKDASANFLDSFGESERLRGSLVGTEVNAKSPQEVGDEEILPNNDEDEKQFAQLSGSKEFWLLLKFFTAMGYTEDVVQRVLAKTGLQEASQILDLVQQEQDRTDRAARDGEVQGAVLTQGEAAAKDLSNKPCETEHREYGVKTSKKKEIINDDDGNGAIGGVGELHDEDFVFGVLKKAAASCGYNEKQVTEVYSKQPDQSMHQLLLELQRKDSKQNGYLKEGPREMDDVVIDAKERINKQNVTKESREEKSGALPRQQNTGEDLIWGNRSQTQQAKQHKQPKQQNAFADNIRGPPLSSYDSNSSQHFPNHQTLNQPNYSSTRPQNPHVNGNDWGRDRRGQQGAVVVTGEQRFLEGLNTRFELRLTDSPGKEALRNIIIDGSNVAMSHGLGHFFSCRGIALAVQHFWDRGHRQISVLLPQWRTKHDYKIKEQHYLTQLKELGIVSLTPSREVQGKRISSYDDRFMLQLAQKTDGVIVTNDNLRDLSDESAAWREIIKKRLLQYTFVGDLFMVPDDPLGRGGPHLDEFLSTEIRSPEMSGLTYNTHYRDRSPGGAWETQRRPGRDGQRQAWTRPGREPEPGPRPGPRAGRSPEETAHLRQQLCQVFPGQDSMITLVLQTHPNETDINVLSALLLEEN
ncbi:protein KHNYN [Boleophthalmus pectinirostris]|uniref:protein KHNYN n=1 Tax=Boleophthalmus pectinirostris TaxID=150288 RepID=UPI00242E4310|nr:protein KHNYN [Boleophthalmus pectinirostris]XP_055012268.1 protein KHNYN [Boleophthalmus pectinirostris]